jgi:ComEC/Rec2-related protein
MTPAQSASPLHQAGVYGALLVLLGGFAAGTLLQSAPLLFWVGWLAVALLGAVFCLVWRPALKTLPLFFYVVCWLSGGAYYHFAHYQAQTHGLSPGYQTVTGVVVGQGPSAGQWVLATETHNARLLLDDKRHRVLDGPVPVGKTVSVSGMLSLPKGAQFPGDFDYRAYLAHHHLSAALYPNRLSVLAAAPAWRLDWQVLRLASVLRARMHQQFQNALPETEAQLLSGIVLGEHATGVAEPIKQQFVRSGLMHILSASGFNVGLIAAFFLVLGRWLRLPLRLNLVVAMLGIGFYCLMTGLPPSVQRAGLMMELALMLKFVRRSLSPVTLLCLTALILFAFQPDMVCLLSFQLSFLSTFGILTMVPVFEEPLAFYLTRPVALVVLVPLVAQWWVMPCQWAVFQQIQLLALPANILAIPMTGVLTYLGFVLGSAALLLPVVFTPLLKLAYWPLVLLKALANCIADLPLAVWHVPAPPVGVVLLLFLTLLGLTETAKRFRPVWPVLLGLALLVLTPLSVAKWQAQQETRLTYLPPGMLMIEPPGGPAWLSTTTLSRDGVRAISRVMQLHGHHHLAVLWVASLQPKWSGLSAWPSGLTLGHVLLSPQLSPEAQAQILAWVQDKHPEASVSVISPTQLVSWGGLASRVMDAPALSEWHPLTQRQCLSVSWGEKVPTTQCAVQLAPSAAENALLATVAGRSFPLQRFTQIAQAKDGRLWIWMPPAEALP